MGLDNLPHEYPCKLEGTVIMRNDPNLGELIDCKATMGADRCPWNKAAHGKGIPQVGIFSTPCCYRGKSGNYMLGELDGRGYRLDDDIRTGFYGDDNAVPNLGPDYCNRLSAWMANHAEQYAHLHRQDADGGEDAVNEYRYAVWWLRWVADASGGAAAWY